MTGPMSLWDAYQKNEVGADNRFRDKRLRLAGLVRAIKKDPLNTIVLELAAKKAGESIACRFDDAWASKVGELERGQLVELECTGRGMVLGQPQLAECAVLWSQPTDTDRFAARLGPSYELCLEAAYREGLARILDAGHLDDGGVIPKVATSKATLAAFDRIAADDRASLRKLGVEPLPCSDPAVVIEGLCDGNPTRDEVPQCSAELVKHTWDHLHH